MAKEEKSTSLVVRMAQKYGLEPTKLLDTLKHTAFNSVASITNEQMAALLIIAEKYDLDPFRGELHAFPSKAGGVVPYVGVDGYITIINRHDDYDGMEFRESDEIITMPGAKPCPSWMEVIIHRKGKVVDPPIREYLDEVYVPPRTSKEGRIFDGHWQTHTKRALRHKTIIQGGRVIYGLSGLYDQDEAERIIESKALEAEFVDATAQIEDAEGKFFSFVYPPDGVGDQALLNGYLKETCDVSSLSRDQLIKNLVVAFTADPKEVKKFIASFETWKEKSEPETVTPTPRASEDDPERQSLIRQIDEITSQLGSIEIGPVFKKYDLTVGKLAMATTEVLTGARDDLNRILDKQLEQ